MRAKRPGAKENRGETTHGAKRPGFKYIGKYLSGEILLTRECSIVTICEDTDSK